MSSEPEALRLADALDDAASVIDMGRPPSARSIHRCASAELRRLHAENEALAKINRYCRADMCLPADAREADCPRHGIGSSTE